MTASPGVRHGSLTCSFGTSSGAATPCAQVSRWPLRPAATRAQEAVLGEHDAVGHHLALRDGGAEAPSSRDQHLAFGGLAQTAAGGARGNQRLDQHAHGGVGGRQAVIVHVAARMRGPQRGPAGAHRGEEFVLNGEAEEALELAGEIGALAVLDQRGGAHHAAAAIRQQRAPGGEQWLQNVGRDRLFVERKPDLHRQLARARQVGGVVLLEQVLDAEMAQLMAIGRSGERKAARRRQVALRQRRQIGRLRPDVLGVGGGGRAEREDELGHLVFRPCRLLGALPLPVLTGRGLG